MKKAVAIEKPEVSDEVREYLRGIARMGSSLGGKARAAKLSRKRRKEIATNAVAARIAKQRKAKRAAKKKAA